MRWLAHALVLTAPVSLASTPLRVACVGDSITAGYKASNASMAYPGRLQQLLDARSPGRFAVTNLGAGGATLQKNTTSPYWKRDQYAQFVNGTWDVIVIMLGTNDAHEEPADWPESCSLPDPAADSCTFISDYHALLSVARARTTDESALLAIAVPPPLMREGIYEMNQTVINDLLPRLVPQVAAEARLPQPIDVYTALGGTSDWRDVYPFCGCGGGTARNALDAANFTLESGYPRKGDDFDVANLTYAEAEAECAASDKCSGFTFNTSSPKPEERTETYLKRCHDYLIPDEGWWTWMKPMGPLPPQPPSCALFCDEQSCDQCHPNDNGYLRLAMVIADFILKHSAAGVEAVQYV